MAAGLLRRRIVLQQVVYLRRTARPTRVAAAHTGQERLEYAQRNPRTDHRGNGWQQGFCREAQGDINSASDALIEVLFEFPHLPGAAWWHAFFTAGRGSDSVDGIQSLRDHHAHATRTHWEFSVLVGDGHVLTIAIGPRWDLQNELAAHSVHIIGTPGPEDDFTPSPLLGTSAIVAVIAEMHA